MCPPEDIDAMQQLDRQLGISGRDAGLLHAERIALLWLSLSGYLDTLRGSPLSLRVETFFCFNGENFHKTHMTPCVSCCRWVRAFVEHFGVAVRFCDSGGAVLAKFDPDGTGLLDCGRLFADVRSEGTDGGEQTEVSIERRLCPLGGHRRPLDSTDVRSLRTAQVWRQTAENLKRLESHPTCRPSIQAQAGEGARLELAQAKKKKDEPGEDCSTTRNSSSTYVSRAVPTHDGWSKVEKRRKKSRHDDQAGGETPQPPAASTCPSKKKDTTTTAEQKAAEDGGALVAFQPGESAGTTVPKPSEGAVEGSPPCIIDARRDQGNRATSDAQPEVPDSAATNKRPTKKRKTTNRSTRKEKVSVLSAGTGDKRRRAQDEDRVAADVAFLPSSYRARVVGVLMDRVIKVKPLDAFLAGIVVAILALHVQSEYGAVDAVP
jgi:hypothetical protein